MHGYFGANMSNMDGQGAQKISSKRSLTTREQIILLESSKLNGNKFPPWEPPKLSEFDDTNQFTETGELSLSRMQLEIFDGWKRPAEIAESSLPTSDSEPTMQAMRPIDLVQDITNDCSVVASLCAASARLVQGLSDVMNQL